jgi:hypothetical protein
MAEHRTHHPELNPMSALIILATGDKVKVREGRATTTLTAGVAGGDRLSYDIATVHNLRVQLTSQDSSCELHRDNPDGSAVSAIQAGDSITRCLQASKMKSNEVKRGKFWSRPQSRNNDAEIPGHSPGLKTHGKKDKNKVISYSRGEINVEIKP